MRPRYWRVVAARDFRRRVPLRTTNFRTQTLRCVHNFRDAHVPSRDNHDLSTLYVAREAERLTAMVRKKDVDPHVVIEASNRLLQISKPSNELADAIIMRKNNESVSKIHRAFLSFTEASLPVDVDCAITLARRAQELSLPLHLQLYKKMMECVASTSMDRCCETIMEIASWLPSSLEASVQTSIFSESLILLAQRDVRELHRLLSSIVNQYPDDHIEAECATRILLILRDRLRLALDDLVGELYEEEVSGIVKILEDSLIEALEDYEPTDEGTVAADPLDQAVGMVMLRGISDVETRDLLSDYLRSSGKSMAPNITFEFDAESGNMMIMQEGSDGRTYNLADDLERRHFPDVTDQLISMNGGRRIQFTRLFEEILCQNEANPDYFEELITYLDSDDDDSDDDSGEDL